MTDAPDPELHPAFEVIQGGDGRFPALLTCEHASNRLPEPWRWSERDRRLVDMHWAIDTGAAQLTRELAVELEASAVLARFSRLLADPNRPEDSETLFRDRCDGVVVDLNRSITESDRTARLEGYYRPFHAVVDRVAVDVRPRLLLSIHSYTPEYEGTRREVEIGVLHCDQPDLAAHWERGLTGHGFDVRINEPYSGAGGFMYSAWVHAERAGCPALELEVRSDRLEDPAARRRVRALIVAQLRADMAATPDGITRGSE